MERGPNIIIDMNKDKVISNSQLLSSSLKGFKDKNIITTIPPITCPLGFSPIFLVCIKFFLPYPKLIASLVNLFI
jgi:hypothetical protein